MPEFCKHSLRITWPFEANLPSIFGEAVQLIEDVDPDKPWIDPYHEFVEIAEKIRSHYRTISEGKDFSRRSTGEVGN